jgi:S-adenosylmethionine synthetase
VALAVDSFGTGTLSDDQLTRLVNQEFDLSPPGIIENLDLRRPIFAKTAVYGHFGRSDPDFTWEAVTHQDRLQEAAKTMGKAAARRPARGSRGGKR